MKANDYQAAATRTEAPAENALARITYEVMRLDHAAKGLCTEVGEFTDVLKRHLFYGAPLDRLRLKEEVGDILWYAASACEALGIRMEDVMTTNVAKLKARYPSKFTEQGALTRNLQMEDKALKDH